MNKTYKIKDKDAGRRLDKFLVEKQPKISRSQIQKIIESGQVLVNGKAIKKHHWLDEGDKVVFPRGIGAPATEKIVAVPNASVGFRVVKEEKDYVVIEKPAGVIVHQSHGHPEPDTLANGLLARYPEVASVGDVDRPGIVHRLDKDVSGLMVVARTPEMFGHLKEQFRNRTVKKKYLALVHGAPQKTDGIIDLPISRSYSDRKKMGAKAAGADAEGKEAITHFEVLQKFERYALLGVEIKTGRTHQIRVHLNAYSCPVLGDKTYRPRNLKTSVNLGRLFLHAHFLGFADLGGNWQEFEAPLPDPLQKFLKTLA